MPHSFSLPYEPILIAADEIWKRVDEGADNDFGCSYLDEMA